MSIKLMTAVWGMDLTSTRKLVLLALADNANDEGLCWPSIRTICSKTSLSERTVQETIRTLAMSGHLTIQERRGHSSHYIVRPPQQAHPADTAPLNVAHHTPAPTAPHPRSRRTQNHHEPSKNLKKPANAVDKREEGKRLLPRVIAAISHAELRKSLPTEVHEAVRQIGDWYSLGMKPRDLRGQTEQAFLNAYADL